MNDTRRGMAAMVLACAIWGLSPLFYKQLAHVQPLEVLSYRTLWSLVFFGLVLAVQRRLRELSGFLFHNHLLVGAAALLISINWGLYIWSIQVGRAMEASLGYYIFPLVAVLLGAVFFRERLAPLKWLAVGLAGAGVLALTLGLHLVPLVALSLAVTFGLYGLIKKRIAAGAVISVTGEVLLLAPLAIGWLIWLWFGSGLGADADDIRTHLLLAASGPLTAGPLILFSFATRRVRMSTIGLMQYINPTLQFLCAAVVFGEPFTQWHATAFGLIWAALALYSGQAVLEERAIRRASTSVGTSGTV
ncbi:chloramphenicol-sensitive protein RarD [Aliiruegeria haliotis]|uniref:Chloramphenicol-sensitive protein RarD n=1 Tax=Aliiruegeria haliotis TaxID=1280846 RepID=A0A2T0RVK0_9RHOB|nr:EamA family transporter RarD [Aliiruegeria haliotis]PRY25229.1 chloramphenicol-sensitive protein RarD [Aliiruegeria haliotis]